MTEAVLGLDTSNYRTSVALVTLGGEILMNYRRLLPVGSGERGLRQSEAVFAHLKQLHEAGEELRQVRSSHDVSVRAVAVSDRPRDGAESYMPVFRAGETAAVLASASLGVPLIRTTHQRGHLMAALDGTVMENDSDILAIHLSGGTTELLHWYDDRLDLIGGSLDLHAGQVVDRVGVAMGLGFPAGPELEALAAEGNSEGKLGASMEDGDLHCHFSGAEAQADRWIRAGQMRREDIAREVYDLLARTVIRMLTAGAAKTGAERALVTGGVAASRLLRDMLETRRKKMRGAPALVFGKPEMSGDNAVGVARIGVKAIRSGGM